MDWEQEVYEEQTEEEKRVGDMEFAREVKNTGLKYLDVKAMNRGELLEYLCAVITGVRRTFSGDGILECLDEYLFDPKLTEMDREEIIKQCESSVDWERLQTVLEREIPPREREERFCLFFHLMLETAFSSEDPAIELWEKVPFPLAGECFEYEDLLVVRDEEALCGRKAGEKQESNPQLSRILVEAWFDTVVDADELERLWKEKLSVKIALSAMVRHPSGLHEWLMVSQLPNVKRLGFTWKDVKYFRTPIHQCAFLNPENFAESCHGETGSTHMHNELAKCFYACGMEMFLRRLLGFASRFYPAEGAVSPPSEFVELCRYVEQRCKK